VSDSARKISPFSPLPEAALLWADMLEAVLLWGEMFILQLLAASAGDPSLSDTIEYPLTLRSSPFAVGTSKNPGSRTPAALLLELRTA
jgi:hypothetical protein